MRSATISRFLVQVMVLAVLFSIFGMPAIARETYGDLVTRRLSYEDVMDEVDKKAPSEIRRMCHSSTDFLNSMLGTTSLVIDMGTAGQLDKINASFANSKSGFDTYLLGLSLVKNLLAASDGEDIVKALNGFAVEYGMAKAGEVVSNLLGGTAVLPSAAVNWFLNTAKDTIVGGTEEALWGRYKEWYAYLLDDDTSSRALVRGLITNGTLSSRLAECWDDLEFYVKSDYSGYVSGLVKSKTDGFVTANNLVESFRDTFLRENRKHFDDIAAEVLKQRAEAQRQKVSAALESQLKRIRDDLDRKLTFTFKLIDAVTGLPVVDVSRYYIKAGPSARPGYTASPSRSSTGILSLAGVVRTMDVYTDNTAGLAIEAIGFAGKTVNFTVTWSEALSKQGQYLGEISLEPIASSTVTAKVTDSASAKPMSNASCYLGSRQIKSGKDGSLTFNIRPGTYGMVISAPGYMVYEQAITAAPAGNQAIQVALTPLSTGDIAGVPAKSDLPQALPASTTAPAIDAVMAAYGAYARGEATAVGTSIAVWNAVIEHLEGVRYVQAKQWLSGDYGQRIGSYNSWEASYRVELEKLVKIVNREQQNSLALYDEFRKEWQALSKAFADAEQQSGLRGSFADWASGRAVVPATREGIDEKLDLSRKALTLELDIMLRHPDTMTHAALEEFAAAKNAFTARLDNAKAELAAMQSALTNLTGSLPVMSSLYAKALDMKVLKAGFMSGPVPWPEKFNESWSYWNQQFSRKASTSGVTLASISTRRIVDGTRNEQLSEVKSWMSGAGERLHFYNVIKNNYEFNFIYQQNYIELLRYAEDEYEKWRNSLVLEGARRQRMADEAGMEHRTLAGEITSAFGDLSDTMSSLYNSPINQGTEWTVRQLDSDVMASFGALTDVKSQLPKTIDDIARARELGRKLEVLSYQLDDVLAVAYGHDAVKLTEPSISSGSRRFSLDEVKSGKGITAESKALIVAKKSAVAAVRPYVDRYGEYEERYTQAKAQADEDLEFLRSSVSALEEAKQKSTSLQGFGTYITASLMSGVVRPLELRLPGLKRLANDTVTLRLVADAGDLLGQIHRMAREGPTSEIGLFYSTMAELYRSKSLAPILERIHPLWTSGSPEGVADEEVNRQALVTRLEAVFPTCISIAVDNIYPKVDSVLSTPGRYTVNYDFVIRATLADGLVIQESGKVTDVLIIDGDVLRVIYSTNPIWGTFGWTI